MSGIHIALDEPCETEDDAEKGSPVSCVFGVGLVEIYLMVGCAGLSAALPFSPLIQGLRDRD